MLHLNKSRQSFFINGELTPSLIESLQSVTSYYVQGYERTDRFQNGLWDGKEHLMRRAKNGSYYFPPGLVDIVTGVLDIWGVGWVIEPKGEENEAPKKIEPGESHELRPYQRDALNSLISDCYQCSGVISLPTGAGKTRIALFWAKRLGIPFFVLVHRIELLRQWKEEIEKYFGYTPTIIGQGKTIPGDCRTTVAMVQTLAAGIKKDKDWSADTGLLCIDEVHTCPAKTSYDVAMRINSTYRLGLSATPTRSDGAELKIFAACGKVVSAVSVESLVDENYLARPVFRMERMSPVRVGYDLSWAEVYKAGVVLNMIRNERIATIAGEYLSKTRQVYVHVSQITHGKTLTGMIPGAVFVCGSTKKDEREQTISDFKSGKIRCLISTLLKEGVSIDGISCLIYASGGKSEVSMIQTIGRALRVDRVFGDAVVVDFRDAGHRILENHVQSRVSAYRRVYGELFQY